MKIWKTEPYDFPLPDAGLTMVVKNGMYTMEASADYTLAVLVRNDIRGKRDINKFIGEMPDPQYKTPIAYALGLIMYAQGLAISPSVVVPENWDPFGEGLKYANIVFGLLDQFPVRLGDPDSLSIMEAWTAGSGQLPGGHAPAPQAAASSGTNVETGPTSGAPAFLGGHD